MPDAAVSFQCLSPIGHVRKNLQSSLGLDHFDGAAFVPYGKTRGIIAPVFQTGQRFQQQRRSFLFSGKPDDPTHRRLLSPMVLAFSLFFKTKNQQTT
jgi:hypothetical protein